MSVCVVAGGIAKALQVTAFTLAWTHSVQKTEWQEDWQVSTAGLTLVEARIKSSGAGIDPPAGALLADGWWRWQPAAIGRDEVVLAQSDAAGDWRVCLRETCQPLRRVIEAEVPGPVTLRPCRTE